VHHGEDLKRLIFDVEENAVGKPAQPPPPHATAHCRCRLGIRRKPDQRRSNVPKEAGAQVDFAGFVETDGVPDIPERAWMKDEPI
jgi:hypothetical protein